jgi:hypothetical protein
MVVFAMRRVPRERPSKDQRKFLEMLRDLGPQDNAQTGAIRKITKRACHVRGWVEWRCIDQCPGVRAWHLTLFGKKALNYPMRGTLKERLVTRDDYAQSLSNSSMSPEQR